MATSQMSEVIQHLRRAVLRDEAGLTDGQLLEEYIRCQDQAALAALVRRHGALVWGVCRRVLGNQHDAEDAFQATFLVLVRKAASVIPREMVANWLYGVAHQTALKARATTAKRRARERQVTQMPEPAVMEPELWSDLQPLLDQELSRLPDIYRVAIVLCDLEGKSRKEAARQLDVAEGTLAARVSRARVLLAKRLAQRGITVSGGALVAMLSQNVASAGVPASVVSSTIKAASIFAARQAAATGAISVRVVALTESVLKAMFMSKLRTATAVLVLLAALAMGASGLFFPTLAAEPRTQVKDPESKPEPPAEGTFVVGCVNNSRPGEVAALFGPDGAARGFVAVGEVKVIVDLRVSPDGKRLAFLGQRPYAGKPQDRGRSRSILDLYVADIGGKDPPTEPIVKDVYFGSFAWAPGSKQLYVSSLPEGHELTQLPAQLKPREMPGNPVPVKTRLVDPATKKATPVDIPEGHGVCDVTPDGKTVLTLKILRYPFPIVERCTSYLVPLATLKPKAITADEEGFNQARFSPDGKRVAGVRPGHMMKAKEKGLFVYDIATERLTPVALAKGIPQENLVQVAWAPDGKRLAVLWWVPAPDGPGAVGGRPPGAPVVKGGGHPIHRITSFDPNGANAKMVQEFKARPFDYLVYGFDWADLVGPGAATGK